MNKGLISLIALSATVGAHAASQQMVWGKANEVLPEFKKNQDATAKGIAKSLTHQAKSAYDLKLMNTKSKSPKHTRYQITYKDIPVWGHELIMHQSAQSNEPSVTGINVSGIEKDVASVDGTLTPDEAEKNILSKVKGKVKAKNHQKVIYIDAHEKAHLAYHYAFYTTTEDKPISAPQFIVDANSGEVLKEWDSARSEKLGQGLGGNAFDLPYRPGMFQHGDALPNLPSLGKFDVQVNQGKCFVQNDHFTIINVLNYPMGYDAFPVTVFDEALLELEGFSYPCMPGSQYLNYADGESGPVNYSFSPVNDTMYFAQKTIDMYKELYGVEKPIGDDLPVRTFTHLGLMDNAFAIPTIEMNGVLLAHQQIAIGNGDMFLTAPAQAVLGHELSHLVTDNYSGLIYDGQPGGINEAFSDMAAIALQDYIRKEHPWYWDGEDWTIGREAMLGGEPMRYMDDPAQDGRSIGHADDYDDSTNVHFSSGVFNKAFYLLSHKPGWNVESAFKVMLEANMNYWSPITYYDFAACGVIQAAKDNYLPAEDVREAFDEVGVQCPHELPDMFPF